MTVIQKNEILLRVADQWLHFYEPRRIIVASTLAEVTPAFLEAEYLVEEKNWYAAGFISYEAASAFDPALLTQPLTDFPYLWFGLYSEPRSVKLPAPPSQTEVLDWKPTIDRETYNAAIAKIKDYIGQGKTYQVNYTMRLEANFLSDPWHAFLHLAQHQRGYAAYVNLGNFVICSASPELFFHLDGETVTCRPMKGTVKRGRTTGEDQAQAEWLKNSEKNRAENVMIVDMIRNDLGRIANIGSVHVPELFCTERYSTLWQMTSTITAQTSAPVSRIFRALFPCASITGAPKVRTMEFIQELETTPRRIYTGTIGYLSPQRKARFSVAIRTILIDRDRRSAEYGVGGGIVWDSTSNEEYAEALLKARLLTESPRKFSLLETMLWTPEQGFVLHDRHICRLLDSADYFGFPASRNGIDDHLRKASANFRTSRRLRILLDENGNLSSESESFQPTKSVVRARLAKGPIDSNDVFLFHKTTRRDVYDNARAGFTDSEDVLLYNENQELTEFTIGNLVVEMEGQLVTPPVTCGLLAGTFRAHLVETGQAAERVVTIHELSACTKIFRVNSIRQWERVWLEE